ncbi:MAG TPA: hypothetical protein HA254_04170 [Candidatus Diapherotrites archaeon]|uniref:Uncharacterized protein n=1 Tax=Candidatus Iainarchaeum sp. TaxID=3101447 RepID=A0A7J4J010_9ARCH|nr:hypothetical protein [Candidatus Diapherotrites archaeon]
MVPPHRPNPGRDEHRKRTSMPKCYFQESTPRLGRHIHDSKLALAFEAAQKGRPIDIGNRNPEEFAARMAALFLKTPAEFRPSALMVVSHEGFGRKRVFMRVYRFQKERFMLDGNLRTIKGKIIGEEHHGLE